MRISIHKLIKEIGRSYPNFDYYYYSTKEDSASILIMPITSTYKIVPIYNYFDCVFVLNEKETIIHNDGGYFEMKMLKNRYGSAFWAADKLAEFFENEIFFQNYHGSVILPQEELNKFKSMCFLNKLKQNV